VVYAHKDAKTPKYGLPITETARDERIRRADEARYAYIAMMVDMPIAEAKDSRRVERRKSLCVVFG
jgi:hypothetical protein